MLCKALRTTQNEPLPQPASCTTGISSTVTPEATMLTASPSSGIGGPLHPPKSNSATGRPADHGISLGLESPYSIQPVQIGMTDEQPGLQRIQISAMGLPFLQRRGRIGRLNERGHPRCPFLSQSILPPESSSLESLQLRPDTGSRVPWPQQSEEDDYGNLDRDEPHRRQPSPFRRQRCTGSSERGAAVLRADQCRLHRRGPEGSRSDLADPIVRPYCGRNPLLPQAGRRVVGILPCSGFDLFGSPLRSKPRRCAISSSMEALVEVRRLRRLAVSSQVHTK